jgi:hypothetical protein
MAVIHTNGIAGETYDAAPQPVAKVTERAQPETKSKAGDTIKQHFGTVSRALTLRVDAPAPPKKSRRKRSGDDEARAAELRKHLKRIFRKVRRHVSDDDRDDRPTFDAAAFHQHQQRVADIGGDHRHDERGLRPIGPHHPSPTL